MLSNIRLNRKLGIYKTDDKDRKDIGWTLSVPLTLIVEPSAKVTVFKEDDDNKEEIYLIVFLSNDQLHLSQSLGFWK